MMMKVLALLLVAVAVGVVSGEEESFRRDRRDSHAASALALESLREALNSQDNALFEATAAVRNAASAIDVNGVEESIVFLSSKVNDLADAADVEAMNDAVNDAIDAATTATVLANQIANSLPPLRSRSEVALDASLSLLRYFASHEKAVVSFEEAYRIEKEALYTAIDALEVAGEQYLADTNFTSAGNAIVSRADALIDFIDNIEVEGFNTLISNLRLTYAFSPSIPTYYWNFWHSYSYYQGWMAGNNHNLYGGVHPSEWDNSYGYAHEMSTDMDVLRGFFPRKITSGYSANVWSQEWYYYSSTNAQHTAVLIRVRNTQSSPINWNVRFYFHNYGSWEEATSTAMNGVNHYTYTSNCGSCTASINYNVPALGTSTIIWVTSSSHPSTTRGAGLAFYDDTLRMPAGLEYVDDLAVATSMYQPEN